MRTLLSVLCLSWLGSIAGCGGGRPLADYGEACALDEDCASGLRCVGTNTGLICASECETDGDCAAHGAMAYCSAGAMACLQMCESDAECDGDTRCLEGFCEIGEGEP